jgi:hypothetical protein
MLNNRKWLIILLDTPLPAPEDVIFIVDDDCLPAGNIN